MKQINEAVRSAILDSRVRADDAAQTATLTEILAAVKGMAEKQNQQSADITQMRARLDAFEAGKEPEPRTDSTPGEAPRDEELHAKMDALAEHTVGSHERLDALTKRMDAFEAAMGGGTEPKPAVGDSTEPTEPKTDSTPGEPPAEPRTDSTEPEPKADSANAALLARVAELERLVPKELAADQRAIFAQVRTDWDKVYRAYGDSAGAPSWWTGETVSAYRQRLAGPHKQHSKQWKDVDLAAIKDDAALSVIDATIRADAIEAVMRPAPGTSVGMLRMVPEEDDTGRKIRRYVGDASVFTAPFKAPVRRLAGLKTRFA